MSDAVVLVWVTEIGVDELVLGPGFEVIDGLELVIEVGVDEVVVAGATVGLPPIWLVPEKGFHVRDAIAPAPVIGVDGEEFDIATGATTRSSPARLVLVTGFQVCDAIALVSVPGVGIDKLDVVAEGATFSITGKVALSPLSTLIVTKAE